MDLKRVEQLLNGDKNAIQLSDEQHERQSLRDKILQIKEFQNLRKQFGGDFKIFDECLNSLTYEFYPKNSLIHYFGQKRERFYFILEGSCGLFQQKEDAHIGKEIHYYGQLQELQSSLKQQQNKLQTAGTLEDEQNALYQIKQLNSKISIAVAALNVYRKEGDSQRLKEAIKGIQEQNQRNKIYQKHFQLNSFCLFTKVKSLISGDTIDQINLNGKDIKSTTITFEDSHVISISIEDYTRIFSHINNQIYLTQRILRSYFPEIPEETVQMLSYEFSNQYYERNEVIYHQCAQNPHKFFILLTGNIEMRKYTSYKKLPNISTPQQQKQENDQNQKNSDKDNNSENNDDINQNENNNDNDEEDKLNDKSKKDENEKNQKQLIEKKIKEKIEAQRIFSVNDNYHSIMIFSGQQVFGTECNKKINEYSAVSISADTKIIALDKKKFDLYDHQFNFRGFLKKQAHIQNKFYLQRLEKLVLFSDKIKNELKNSRQLIQIHARQKSEIPSRNLEIPKLNLNYNKINLDTNQQIDANSQNELQQKRLIQSIFVSPNDQNLSSRRDLSSSNRALTNRNYKETNNNLPLSSRNLTQSTRNISSNDLDVSSANQNLTFKSLVSQLLNSRNDNKLEEEERKKEEQLHAIKAQIKCFEQEQGFDFELNSDKKRRQNILIDHRIKKQLNMKAVSTQNDSLISPEKMEQPSNNTNSNVKKYAQREGKFPWLDQFGYRKQMESNGNVSSLNQIESKMKKQDQISKELHKRSGCTPNQRGRYSSLHEQLNQNNNLTSWQEIQQQQEKQSLTLISPIKSCVNLDLTNKKIQSIKSSINLMKEQDQQENEQINSFSKIFSTNRIFKVPNSQQSIHDIGADFSQIKDSQPQSLANFTMQESNREIIVNPKSFANIINSPMNIKNSGNFTDRSSRKHQDIEQPRKIKDTYTTRRSLETENTRRTIQTLSTQNNECDQKLKIDNLVSNSSIKDNEVQSSTVIPPIYNKQRSIFSVHLDSHKKDLTPLSFENIKQIKNQVNLLKKRNLIQDNFSPSVLINTSQTNKQNISKQTNQNNILNDILTDQHKESLQFKKYNDINSVQTPLSQRDLIQKQLTFDQSPANFSPNSIDGSGSKTRESSQIKNKVSFFVR